MGLVLLGIALVVIIGSAAWAGWRAAPFVPTFRQDVERMMSIANVRAGDTVIDAGCGDGRLLLAAAERGAVAIGYEISIVPFVVAWLRGKFSPDRKRIIVHASDAFRADCRQATVIFLFLTPRAMPRVKAWLEKYPVQDRRVISYAFPILGWHEGVRHKPDPQQISLWEYRG